MQRSSVLCLLFAAVAAIAVAVAVYASGDAPAPGPTPPGRMRFPPPDPHRAIHGDDTPAVPRGAPQVHVEVRDEATFVPPPPERVFARVAGEGAWLPATVLAGEGAGFDPPRARPGLAMIAIALDGGHRLLRQLALGDEGQTEYRLGARVVVRGHVTGDQDWPLRGAEVWLGELDADGQRRTATTDAEGAFELDTPDGAGVPCVVTAPKRAVHWQVLAVAPPGPDLRIALGPGASLEVQLAAAADDIGAARVFVVPTGAVSTALAQHPFFLQALTDGHAVGANGRATVPDLPIDGTLAVLVRHPRLPGMAPVTVTLRDSPQRVVVPLQFAEAAWTGRVVDTAGAPLAAVSVWSRQPGQPLGAPGSARLLPPQAPGRGVCATATDAEGAFTVGAVPAPDALVSLRAWGFAGLDVAATSLRAAAPIVLPAWRGGDPAFHLLPPASGVGWQASTDLGGGVQAVLEPDQPWVVSFPHAGRFTVVVTTRTGDVVCGSETFHGLDVTGPVELASPRLP